jgi:citrate lyase subunit alpha / citrate CoA-transferase
VKTGEETKKSIRRVHTGETTIEELRAGAVALTGEPDPLEFLDRVVGIIRYRDGSVIDIVRQVKN